jgi:SNF2 family DNA or RNA helicase
MMTLPLHPYQEPAVELFLERGSLLVAYEMCLGKTPIAIACAEELLGCRDARTVLIVVPASLRYQWAQALVKFTDVPTTAITVSRKNLIIPVPQSCLIIDGPPAKRRKLLGLALNLHPEYVICSYDIAVSDTRLIKRLHPSLVILDEASAIKNFGAERTRTIKRSLAATYRIALTGTPVENKPEEAFSIMEWVDEDVLGAFDLFEKTYIERYANGTVRKHKNLRLLNKRLSAAMVRRSRADPEVAKYLPEVDHDQWYPDMDQVTKQAYGLLADELLSKLQAVVSHGNFDMSAYYAGNQFSEITGLGKVMARQQAIELFLDHPALVERSAARYADQELTSGSQYCHELIEEGVLTEAKDHHPKLDFLVGKLEEILQFEGNKVLVFSRWPQMLELIEEQLAVGCVRYHGGMNAGQKAVAIHEFTTDRQCRVFLSSHAGAYGTDMHMANYLINYDLPWSGGTWDQINGRHQRVSSEFGKVFVRDIIMSGTLEERKLAMLRHKLRVSAAVVDGKVSPDGRIENDLQSLTTFLSK